VENAIDLLAELVLSLIPVRPSCILSLTRHSFRHSGTCVSYNLIYLLLCNLCSTFYAGGTQIPL